MNLIVPPKIYLLVQTGEQLPARCATETGERHSVLASCSAENGIYVGME